MTSEQLNTMYRYNSFLNNIGKLSKGRATQLSTESCDYGRVECITKGQRPRLFSVSGSTEVPAGKYSYRGLIARYLERV